jgi:hypothetical protein
VPGRGKRGAGAKQGKADRDSAASRHGPHHGPRLSRPSPFSVRLSPSFFFPTSPRRCCLVAAVVYVGKGASCLPSSGGVDTSRVTPVNASGGDRHVLFPCSHPLLALLSSPDLHRCQNGHANRKTSPAWAQKKKKILTSIK